MANQLSELAILYFSKQKLTLPAGHVARGFCSLGQVIPTSRSIHKYLCVFERADEVRRL